MAKTVIVEIDLKTAEVELTTDGYHGVGCGPVMKGFNTALGGEILENTNRAEYNKPLTKNVCVKS
jgi:hypothetical protein